MRIAVFTFALVVRIAAIELVGAQNVTFGDGPDYLDTAQVLCTQHEYPERGNLPFFRAPGFPFFIAGVTLCSPGWTRAIKYGLAVCDAISVLLIFLIAQSLGTNAWIAALFASLHPFFVMAVTDIRSEPLFMMFLTAAIWLLLRSRPALTGLALGLAALTRPTALLCIPLFALFFRRRFTVVLFAALLTLAPWTIRNYLRFGELLVVNDATGFNLWRGTNPELMKIVATHDTEEFRRRSWRFESQTVAETARLVDARAKTPGTRDREWRKLALENVRSNPAFAVMSTLKKIAMYWRPWLHPAEHGPKAIASSLAVNLGLFVLGAIGLARHRDRRLVLAVIVFFAAMWLAHLPYIPTIRLRVPLTDPLLIVFAAGSLRGKETGQAPMSIGTVRALRILHGAFRRYPARHRIHTLIRFLTCPFLRFVDDIPPGARVLEIGSGHALYGALIIEERAREVIAVDPDLRKSLLPSPSSRIRKIAGYDESIRGTFDVAVLIDVVYRLSLDVRRALFARALQRLNPGGLLIVKEMDPSRRMKMRWARFQESISDNLFGLTIGEGFVFQTREELAAMLTEIGFTDVTARAIDRGYLHPHIVYTARRPQ